MARFLGTDKNEFIDEMRVEGNFFDLLDAGLAFCFKHLNLSGKITNHSLQREERLEIPYKALREAIINSLCHRQWEKYNLLNSIAIYDDRVEIGNPGIFPSQITPENIKEPHDSYPYNVKMAEVLYRSMWLENWGSGAKRIMDACHEQGVEEPSWRWEGAFVYITFKRPLKLKGTLMYASKTGEDDIENPKNDIENGKSDIEKPNNDIEAGESDIDNSRNDKEIERVFKNYDLTASQMSLIFLITENPSITLELMAKNLNVTIRKIRTLRKELERKGILLCHKGSTKKGVWEIKHEQI